MADILHQSEEHPTVDLNRTIRAHPVKMSPSTKNQLWRLRQQQNEAFNHGVELGLGAHASGDRIPTAYDGHAHLVTLRDSGQISSTTSTLQRAGIELGLNAVKKWATTGRKHVWRESKSEQKLDKAITNWNPHKPTPKQIKALQVQFLSHSRAVDKLRRHQDKGTSRLFRRRKELERVAGPSLSFLQGCRIQNGCLLIPGGLAIPLAGTPSCVQDINPNMSRFTGAARIVDVTNLAGKVTVRTEPKHRKYIVHLSCKRTENVPPVPAVPEEIVGVDWGVAIPLQVSDGVSYGITEDEREQIHNPERAVNVKALQRSMSSKVEGSSRHQKDRRRKAKLQQKNQNTRINYQRHVAKDIATRHKAKRVSMESTRASKMTASAKGTAVRHGKNVQQKTGLNRSICRVAPARQRDFIRDACANHSVGFVCVNPAGTSQTCFVCGEEGIRETQAVFSCQRCLLSVNADLVGSLNIGERGGPTLFWDASTPGGRECRRKMLETATAVMEASRTNAVNATPTSS